MISNKMTDALNEQINAELWSAYLYLAMSLDAESKGLKGVANWFYIQWLEEQDHARIFENYLIAQNARVSLMRIDAVPDMWDSAFDMFHEALEHEKEVTHLIDELVKLAFAEHDFATLSRLWWFVDEQVEEESSIRDILERFDSAGWAHDVCFSKDEECCSDSEDGSHCSCCGCILHDLDQELLSRQRHLPSPLAE